MRTVNWMPIRARDRRVPLTRRVRVSVGEGAIVKKSLFFLNKHFHNGAI